MVDKKKDPRNQKHGTDIKNKPMRWEYDILAKDFIPRAHPRAVPNVGIFDEDIYCLKFNEMWIPHIIGALQLLLEKDSWSGGDSEVFRAQQSVLLMLENLVAPCDSGEINMRTPEFKSIVVDENCDQTQWKYVDEPDSAWRNLGTPNCDGADGTDGTDGRSPEFQIIPASAGCQTIQWRYEGDSEWIDLATVCDGADGGDGTDGADGADGRTPEFQTVSAGEGCFQIQWRYEGDSEWINSGDPVCCECEEIPPINPVEPVDEEFDGTACSISINLAQELRRLWQEAWDDTGGRISGAESALLTFVGAATLFLGTWYTGASAVLFIGALAKVLEFAVNGETNAFDDAAEERFRCYLYCILKANNSLDITPDVISEWAQKIQDDTLMPFASRSVTSDIVTDTPIQHWQWLAYASSEVNPAACDCDCPAGACDPQYHTWVNDGATPAGWSVVGAMSTAGMTGLAATGLDTSVAPIVAYGGSRGANQNWTTGNARLGIQYDFDEPCEVTRLVFRTTTGNTNSKRGGIIVKIAATQVWEVLFNTVHSTPTGNEKTWEWLDAANPREIDAVRFLYVHAGSATTSSLTISNINIAI